MAIIEVVKYDGPPGVFAWKYPNQELGTWTQLIVNESQEAILFKGGEALDSFTAGRHTLSTANIPILSNVVNLPFGGKSPFTAEIWFVNKLNSMNVKWGTSAPLQLQDPKYKIMVAVRAFGQFGVRIEDPRKFLLKLVGTLPLFDQDTMINYFRGLLMSNINELISSYLVHKKSASWRSTPTWLKSPSIFRGAWPPRSWTAVLNLIISILTRSIFPMMIRQRSA